MDKNFLFDLDDTLIQSQIKYSIIQAEFVKFVARRLGYKSPDAKTTINLQSKIDHDLVDKMGFSRKRFPESFRETFKQLSYNLGIKDKEGEEAAYLIAKEVFNEHRWLTEGIGMLSGAKETLDFLNLQTDSLKLVTLGDKKIQSNKIKIYNLEKWFRKRDIHITDKKDTDFFKDITKNLDKANTWVVGNSIRSDVIPAYEAGLRVLYIPCETWDYDRVHNGIPKTSRITELDNISDIIQIYSRL